VVVKADKGSLRHPQKIFLFLLPKTKEAKQKEYFLVCPCIFAPQPLDTQALCLTVFFAVGWLAGG
jgi:hypothetical protein